MNLPPYLDGLRPIEILILAYLIPTTLLAIVRFHFLSSPRSFFAIRIPAIVFVYLMRWTQLPIWLRDWYPLLGYIRFYQEITQLNRLLTKEYFDKKVIGLEQRIFRGQPSIYVSERLPDLWLSDFLSFGYLLYYALIPVTCFTIYQLGLFDAFRETTFIIMLVFHVCFYSYIVFPVASPYYEFPRMGEPYSSRLFNRLIMSLLRHGSSKGSAFPSSHVAIGLSLLMCVGTFHVALSLVIAPLVIGLVLATVYGRYHYALDSFAGIAVAVCCYPLGHWLYTTLQ